MADLTTVLGPLKLPNPVLVASGTFGYGEEYGTYIDLNQLGGLVVKGTTLHPRGGNRPPRIVETPAGLLNSVGLQNPGVDAVIREELPKLTGLKCPVIVNIAGSTVGEYAEVAARLNGQPSVAALEINISCPNVEEGGLAFGTDPVMVRDVVQAVREATTLPLICKLSPNVGDIVQIAEAAVEGGAQILSLINTVLGMSIDVQARRPVLANTFGGLSGPAIRPIALRMVWEVYAALRVPIIGMGGITSGQDALEFILAGAGAIAVGSANFVDPRISVRIIRELEAYIESQGLDGLSSLVGAAHP
ncbi:MAG: dihydroorotate dehydrogenase [Firmicutes bacterium]|jgi:dihydroorotate dehydrogenase (NAD+) catalytic subunit|nr:dihydroorotate dehydrogenase [Bacillota bacterium]